MLTWLATRIRQQASQAQLRKIMVAFDMEPLVLLLSFITILFGFILILVTTGRYAREYPTLLLGTLMWLSGLNAYVGVALAMRKVAIIGVVGIFFHWFLNSGIIIYLATEVETLSLTVGLFIAILIAITLACLWCSIRLALDPQRLDSESKQ